MKVDRSTIRQFYSIYEIVIAETFVQRDGNVYRGSCPFHTSHSLDFQVNPTTGTFRCFKCHKKGDAVEFVRLIRGGDLLDAMTHIMTHFHPSTPKVANADQA